jgi:hypothetical protein
MALLFYGLLTSQGIVLNKEVIWVLTIKGPLLISAYGMLPLRVAEKIQGVWEAYDTLMYSPFHWLQFYPIDSGLYKKKHEQSALKGHK